MIVAVSSILGGILLLQAWDWTLTPRHCGRWCCILVTDLVRTSFKMFLNTATRTIRTCPRFFLLDSERPTTRVRSMLDPTPAPKSSVGPSISNDTFDIEDFDIESSFDIAPSISFIDIGGVRYGRSPCSISKVTNLRYRRS
jgi:hypothetical protein